MAQITLNSTGVASSGALTLQSNGTTTAVTVDTSQNVGIGTTSPSSYGLLTVLSSTAGSAKISIQDTSGGASPAPLIQFGVNSSNGFNTSDAARVWTTSPSSSTAALNFAAYSGGAPTTAQMTLTGGNVGIGTSSPAAHLEVSGTETGSGASLKLTNTTASTGKTWHLNSNNSGKLFFSIPSVVDAMVIDSSGNLLVGTTSSVLGTPKFQAVNATDTSALFQCGTNSANNIRSWMNTASGSRFHIAFGDGTTYTERGSISTNGTNTAYNTSSDYRLKENVQPLIGALSLVARLKPSTFKWKETGEEDSGFIAHELQEVCPSAVNGEKDAVNDDGSIRPQQIDTSFLVATLTAAIQEQQALITALTARIEALENK